LGAEGIAGTYYLGLCPKEMMLDLGIIYYLIYGFAGAFGNFITGIFLDGLAGFGVTPFISYKILFAALSVITLICIILQQRLAPLGSLPLKNAMEIGFSVRDLRAISILDKLNKTSDAGEEEELLEQLQDTPSSLSTTGLLERIKSPRLVTRQEALRAIDALKTLDSRTVQALMDDAIDHPFTTAYISARALGRHNCSEAITVLRELSASKDYMLAGESIIALARLKDTAFLPQIEELLLSSDNPRLVIMGVEALGIFGYEASLTVLLDILKKAQSQHAEDSAPYLRDEVTLAMSGILQVESGYYKLLVQFLEDESRAESLCVDDVEEAAGKLKGKNKKARDEANRLKEAVADYAGGKSGSKLARWLLMLDDDAATVGVKIILSESVLDDELLTFARLRILICHWCSTSLK
jgi:HEAT repeat protein